MKKTLAITALSALAFSGAAFAEGGYVGVGGGNATTNISWAGTGVTTSHSATSVDVFGGYKVNSNFAIEAEYINLGKFSGTGNAVSLDGSGFGVSAVGIAPFGNGFSVNGKIGITNTTSNLTAGPGFVLLVPASESKTGVSFGVGAEYEFTPNAAVRLSYTSYQYSAGGGFLTGRFANLGLAGVFSF